MKTAVPDFTKQEIPKPRNPLKHRTTMYDFCYVENNEYGDNYFLEKNKESLVAKTEAKMPEKSKMKSAEKKYTGEPTLVSEKSPKVASKSKSTSKKVTISDNSEPVKILSIRDEADDDPPHLSVPTISEVEVEKPKTSTISIGVVESKPEAPSVKTEILSESVETPSEVAEVRDLASLELPELIAAQPNRKIASPMAVEEPKESPKVKTKPVKPSPKPSANEGDSKVEIDFKAV